MLKLPQSDRPAAALAAVLGAMLAATFLALTVLAWAPLLCLLFVAAVGPGVVLARRVYGTEPGAAGMAWLVGPVWGFALTSIVLLAVWAAGLHHPIVLLLAPGLSLGVAVVIAPRQPILKPAAISAGELKWVLVVLLLVPIVDSRPYSQVGVNVEDGRAYRAYFTADFVWKMAVVAEVAKGDLPPVNPFIEGEPLHYYWLPHLFSAVEHRAFAPWLRLEPHLLVNATLFGLTFILFLFALARQSGASPPWAAAGVAIAVFGGSFEGAERLYFIWKNSVPFDFLLTLNIDAVSRWFYSALPTDGLHRLLLYQPQHHAMAYASGMSAILAIWQARRLDKTGVWLLAGGCLAACLLLSAFSALMLFCMIVPVAAIALLRGRHYRAIVPAALAAAVPCGTAAAVALALGYVQFGEALIVVQRNAQAFTNLWTALPLNFGLALPVILVTLVMLIARRADASWMLGVPLAIAFWFYFFVDVRDMQGVYVGWRVGHLVFMMTAPLAAWLLHQIWQSGGVSRAAGVAAVVAGAVLAMPTIAIDLYNTQDVRNRRMAAGFPWTLVLSPDEQAALQFIRDETPWWAVVQVDPFSRHPTTWSYIPSFAERRMAAGLPTSMIPLEPYEKASKRIQHIFAASTAQEAFEAAVRNHVDYIVVGPPEQEDHPHLTKMFSDAPQVFPLVFETGTVRVYQVGKLLRHPPRHRTGLLTGTRRS